LDRIYLSPGLGLESARVIEEGPASLASDHLPVVAKITLAPAPEMAPGPVLTDAAT
jgi:endonuclease/exonuclease/phosphatase family metal-dependent hydrolase